MFGTDRRIGIAGVVLAFLGIGITILYPDKRVLGWVFLLVGLLALAVWIFLEIHAKTRSIWYRLIGGSTLVALLVLCGFNFWPAEVKPPTARFKPMTLKELYLSDFNGTMFSVGYAPNTMEDDSKHQITFEARMLYDPTSSTKFVAFYLPSTPYAFLACESLAVNIDPAVGGLNNLHIKGPGPDSEPMNTDKYKFSGRVFIYIENFIPPEENGDLHNFFKEKGLELNLRGAEYERQRNLERLAASKVQ